MIRYDEKQIIENIYHKPDRDPDEPIGSWNRFALENIKFSNTIEFSPAANHKRKHGYYCNAPFKSKEYTEYWQEQKKRCLEGYINPITGVRITGYHYFFLNFKQMEITENPHAIASRKIWDFPRFWAIHWHFFMAIEEAEKFGKNICLLKPRGTGFSEIFSSMGTRDYTLLPHSKSSYYASHKDYFIKDGIITKAWKGLEFLNKETERGFKHLRQGIDQTLHKRASKVNSKGEEIITGGEILARVIDDPNKVRGGRNYKIYYEEGGSFPKLDRAWFIAEPTVIDGGVVTGMQIVLGTGGEDGPGIIGLDDIFNNPSVYRCLEFENTWDVGREGTFCGFFFPVEACMSKYMDEDGNPDLEAGKAFHNKKRKDLRSKSPEKEDKYIAEFPFTPMEALLRISSSHFAVAELQRQLNRVRGSSAIKGFIKHGELTRDETGKVIFKPRQKVKPILKYPHRKGDDLTGCVTMLLSPYTDQNGRTPDNMYQIVVDPFYAEDAEDTTSLGAIYVYKRINAFDTDEDDILVAWYVGRPRQLDIFYKILFDLAQFYNGKIQSEISGGGQGIVSYARHHKLLHWLEEEPDMIHNKELATKHKGFFMNMNTDRKRLGLKYLADWLIQPRSLKADNPDEKASYILNLHKIYDEGLLEELIKFHEDRNFDRISALIILMYMIKEKAEVEVQAHREQNNFWTRELHTDYYTDNSNSFSDAELKDILDKNY